MPGLVAGTEIDNEGEQSALEDVKSATEASTEATIEDQDVDAADPSAAEPEKGPKSMLDAVNAALDGKQEKSPLSESGSDAEGKPKAAGTDKDAVELTPAEEKLLPRKTQKSIERFRSQIGDFKQQLSEVQPKAEGFDRLVNFVNKSNLTPQDLDRGLELMALVRNDPVKAYEQLIPIVVELQKLNGVVLPDDLKKEVDEGFITEERAREISTLRARGQLTETRSTEERNRSQMEQQQEALQSHVDTVAKSATDWEKTKAKIDPDWPLKKDRVAELVELDMARRQRTTPGWFPKSPQEAVDMSEVALKRVNEELKRFGSPRRAVNPVTGSASQSSRPKPKNLMDVINNTLAAG